MDESSEGRGPGRPQKFPGEGARIAHSLRLKPAIADRLREAAQEAHRTLGEELELRINKSFEKEEDIRDEIENAVVQKTYKISMEAEYLRLHGEYNKCIYDWNLSIQKKYSRSLESSYYNVRTKMMKKLKWLISNRWAHIYNSDMTSSQALAEMADNDIRVLEETAAASEDKANHLKYQIDSFKERYPEMAKDGYRSVVLAVMRDVNLLKEREEKEGSRQNIQP